MSNDKALFAGSLYALVLVSLFVTGWYVMSKSPVPLVFGATFGGMAGYILVCISSASL